MNIKHSIIGFIFFTLTVSLFAGKTVSVVIDPGHGGKDTGAQGTYIENGKEKTLFEKDIVLHISQKLYTALKRDYPDMPVLLTRPDDSFCSFEKRAAIMPESNGEKNLFISVHNNTSRDTSINGFKVLVNTANKKNKALADSVCAALNKTVGGKMQNLGMSELPSSTKNTADIIIEIGFLSNQSDLLLLSNDEFLSLCANGITDGIKKALAEKI